MNNSEHYDKITKAWQYMLGENFHWGYFENSEQSLEIATDNLINEMLKYLTLKENSKILDIGCGIGTPAFKINKLFNCYITGISNSDKGVNEANSRSQNNKVTFSLRDALNNNFENESFDACWLMEMSHLIEDKNKLIQESVRVLKKGGQIVLCDLMFQRVLTAKEIYDNKENLIILNNSFGNAKIETIAFYKSLFEKNNLNNIIFEDISDKVKTTLIYWKNNVETNINEIRLYLSENEIDNFKKSCDILMDFYNREIWGYGIIYANKN